MYGVWFYDVQIDLSAQLDAVLTCLPERIPSFVCFVISPLAINTTRMCIFDRTEADCTRARCKQQHHREIMLEAGP